MMPTPTPPDPARAAERRFTQRLTIGVGLGLTILTLMAAAAAFLGLKVADHTAWVEHTYVAETKIARLQSLLERGETARRGYLLTGSPVARSDYQLASAAWPEALQDLRSFTADNPRQTRNIDALRPKVEQALTAMTKGVALAETGALDEAVRQFRSTGEVAQIREARLILDNMANEEQRLLRLRSARQAETTANLISAVVLGAVLVGVLALGAVWIIRRYALASAALREELRRLNAGLEEQVETRTADLVRANEEIQRFAYIVSHDLRAPLVNVMGFTSELEAAMRPLRALLEAAEARAPDAVSREARVTLEDDLPEAIRFIRGSTQKMDRLIAAILKLSRDGRRTLAPETVDMTALAHSAAANLRTQAEQRGAEIVVDGDLPVIVTDRLAIEQVLGNLLENGIKYLSPARSGRVVIRGRRERGALIYEVQDNGRGIDPKDHERVFDLFRRSGVQDQPGEGIGLATVKAVVQRLGGVITLTSALDQGATFRLSLPPVLSAVKETAA